jgi:hypothetical protein
MSRIGGSLGACRTSRVAIAWLISALLICSATFLLVSMDRLVNVYDEGIALEGAARVLAGDVIHRDFYAVYGPGQFYVLAALFSIFSPSVLIERGWDIAIRVGTTILCGLVAARLASRFLAALVYLGSLIWLAALGFYGTPLFPSLFFALLSVYLLLPIYEGRFAALGIFSAGLAAAVVTLFRYDLGLDVAVAELSVAVTFLLLQPILPSQERRRHSIRLTVLYAAGFAIPTIPVTIAYVMLGLPSDFWFDTIYYAKNVYGPTRSLPFPEIELTGESGIYETAVYLPVVIWVASAICLLGPRCNARQPTVALVAWDGDRSWAALQLLVMSILFFLNGLVRISPNHMTLATISSLVLLAVVAGPQLARRRVATVIAAGCLLVAGYFTAAPLAMAFARTTANLRWALRPPAGLREPASAYGSCHPPPGLERLACLDSGHANLDAVLFVQSLTKPDDYLFVGTGRHDKIFVNNVIFYFLAQRRPATKWYKFDPGVQTSDTIQKEMISELNAKKPPVIVLDSEFDLVMEPNASRNSSHVVVLDQFLRANYRQINKFGDVSVLARIAD